MTHPLELALSRSTETSDVDFKSTFDVGAARDWLLRDALRYHSSFPAKGSRQRGELAARRPESH